MRIVHYTLGLFPQRSGGLNRYATDLMMELAKENEVSVLTPGGWRPWSNTVSIKDRGKKGRICCFLLFNALPLPLFYGIKKPQKFIGKAINRRNFEEFYDRVRPEILHLHTLMGVSEEVLMFFKSKGVKIVYTSHDYFGVCLKVNMVNQNGELCEGPAAKRCEFCNMKSPSVIFLRWRNSSMTFMIRDIIRWIRDTLNF